MVRTQPVSTLHTERKQLFSQKDLAYQDHQIQTPPSPPLTCT